MIIIFIVKFIPLLIIIHYQAAYQIYYIFMELQNIDEYKLCINTSFGISLSFVSWPSCVLVYVFFFVLNASEPPRLKKPAATVCHVTPEPGTNNSQRSHFLEPMLDALTLWLNS